jgi:diketogulonate reductase-like aldo/keto reductase
MAALPRQVVLNFLTRHHSIFTIPKTTRPERVRENSGSVGWELTVDDVALIDRAFPTPDHDTPLGMI